MSKVRVIGWLILVLSGTVAAQTVDLQDAAQYDAYVARLKNAGITPESHADLFQRLAAARQNRSSGAQAASPLKPANFIVGLATDDGDHFSCTGVSTQPGGSSYTLATLQLYNQNDEPIGKAQSIEQHDEGTLAFLMASGVRSSVPGSTRARAILTAYVEPKSGPPTAYTARAEGVVVPVSITNDGPQAKTDPNQIRVCVGRKGKGCDYFSLLSTRFPVKGSVVFDQPVDRIKYDRKGSPTNASVTLLLADATNGGACPAISPGSFFKNNVKITGKTLRWSLDPASFGSCYPRDARFTLAIGVNVKGSPALVSVADIDLLPSKTNVIIPTMSVLRRRPAPAPAKLAPEELSDLRYVREQHKKNGEGDLDLRDPRNYRFMVSQFERAGLTRQRYPQFFASLDAMAKTGPVAAPAQLATDTTEPVNVVIEVKTDDQESFAAQALSSIPGGTNSTLLILGVYNEKGEPIGVVEQKSDFAGGTDVLINAEGDFGTPTPPEGRTVLASGSYFYEDTVGGHHAGFMEAEFAFYPKKIQDDAPIAIKNPKQVVVCLNRTTQNADCDYDCSTGLNCTKQPPSDWDVRFPVKGYIDYFKNIDVNPQGKPVGATSRIVVTFTQSGGACKLPLTGFFDNPNTKVENGSRLVWNIDPATFGTACYPGRSDVTYAFMVNLYTEGTPIAAFINNTGGTPEQNTFKIPPMKIYQGCLAPGSKVTLEDGSDRVVEAFDGGERVRTAGQRGLTVAGTIWGQEGKPLVKITTADGRWLMMSDEHPVPTTKGIRLARQLRASDVVFTSAGQAAIAAVSLEPYNGKVYNLELAAKEGDPKLTMANRTFFANGILVGDSEMQDHWSRVVAKREGLRKIPPHWLIDYQSWKQDSDPTEP